MVPALVLGAILSSTPARAQEAGFTSLFDGRTLAGWDGNPNLWSVRDGAITGQTTPEHPANGNTFLIWTNGLLGDFELRFSYKIVANNPDGFGNSGVQYRSKIINKEKWGVGGYQADFEAGTTYSGILYDEGGVAGGRGIMAERGQKVVWSADGKKQVTGGTGKTSQELQAAIRKDDWNDYVVIADGNHLVHKINGNVTVDVTDDDPAKRLSEGVLALQLHAGKPMTVQFKNITLKKLPKRAAGDPWKKFGGTWEPVEGIYAGNPVPNADLDKIVLTIEGNKYTSRMEGETDTGSFTVDESRNPHAMDVARDGSTDGRTIPAIYEVGEKTLRLCYSFGDEGRPAGFVSPPDSKILLITYRRK